jgi:hypothetical protein
MGVSRTRQRVDHLVSSRAEPSRRMRRMSGRGTDPHRRVPFLAGHASLPRVYAVGSALDSCKRNGVWAAIVS